jgi:hypothetical protein
LRWKKSRVESFSGRELNVSILRKIEIFMRTSDVTAARFGRDAVNDPRFVFDLRNGREPRPETIARVIDFLEETR